MDRRTVGLAVERFALREPFHIAGHVFTETRVLVATVGEAGCVGRGEGAGIYYLGDDAEHMLAEAKRAAPAVAAGCPRADLQALMPPGGARNALDCALWDLEARLSGTPVWMLAGLDRPPQPLPTLHTLGADSPERMANAALRIDPSAPLKVKLTGELSLDKARLVAIRDARPEAWIAVDANQGYDRDGLLSLLPELERLSIAQVEQPLRRGDEGAMEGLPRSIPFVADESALTLADTDGLPGRFHMVNIKLDKCGGLTEALAIARRARQLGLGVMVGNMVGTSLSMAPGYLVGQLCDVVDLDGPMFLAADRSAGVAYRQGRIHCPPSLWGHP
jgi:L-alanine-DL-glutamate epimerase-like enolase superfamily enzyme